LIFPYFIAAYYPKGDNHRPTCKCIKDANGVLPGKTIFFCSSKAHACRMEEIFNKLYPQFWAGEW